MRFFIFLLCGVFIFSTQACALGITSDAFTEGGKIPVEYTCNGNNISPGLSFTGAPNKTQSLALIMDDPDAPGGTFTHWIVYNMPADTPGLRAATTTEKPGINSAGTPGYRGPCPPSGDHHYVFKLYALDTALTFDGGVDRTTLEAAMQGHIIDHAELTGYFAKTQPIP